MNHVSAPDHSERANALHPTTSDRRAWTTYIEQQLRYQFTKSVKAATSDELFRSAAATLRPVIVNGLLNTQRRYESAQAKSVYYLSMEFLLGRSLANNLQNLGLYSVMDEAFAAIGLQLTDVLEAEPDAALGNGGLGRLAACFLDSLASLDMPGFGYGINYEFGLFRQEIDEGSQKEYPDYWASARSPWLIEHLDQALVIPVYGRVAHARDRAGNLQSHVAGLAGSSQRSARRPVVGHGGKTINFLRLFSARASDDFDIQSLTAETISGQSSARSSRRR